MRLVVCIVFVAGCLAAPRVALAVGWLLDPSFGVTGYTTEPSTALEDRVQGIAVQADGKVVAGAYSHTPGTEVNAPDWITAKLIRYDVDGTLDASFGVGGVVSGVPVTGLYAVGRPTVMDDGRILWGGVIDVFEPSFDIVSYVCRFLADGSLDPSFGDGGVVLVPDYWLVPNAPVARPDGRILLSGWKWNVPSYEGRTVAIVQLDADGALDATFGGGDGIVDSDLVAGQADLANDLLLEPDGRIVVGGDTGVYPNPVFDVFVARYLPDGTIDPSFGGGTGFVVTDGGSNLDTLSGVERRPDGRYVAGGYTHPTGLLLIGYDNDGALDTTVGGTGVVVTTFAGGETSTDIALDAEGRVLTAGGSDRIMLVRQLANGSLDPDFGDGGVLRSPQVSPFGGVTLFDVAVHTNGKIYVGGTFYPDEFFVGRYSDGDYEVCAPAPRTGCTTAIQPAAGRLQLSTGTSPDRQKVSWKLTHGDASTPAHLADPFTADDYTVCSYDDAGALLWEAIAPAAGTCHGRPCWSAIPSVGGVKYRDGSASHGITSLVVRPGIAGKTRLGVKARSELRLPALPLDLPVRVQLQIANGGCFEATFSTTTANGPVVFKSRSD
jgi:uncharacterized delta-60 repeat protein